MGNSGIRPERRRHVPVLLEESVKALGCRPGGTYVDCTVGYGGHAAAILAASAPNGRLVGIDRDAAAIAHARATLGPAAEGRARWIHGDYRQLSHHLAQLGLAQVEGVLFDLGASSPQLEDPQRGFSFMKDGPLDMRMDQSRGPTAADLINQLPERQLADMLYQYGEERYSRRIARAIVAARAARPLQTTRQLVDTVTASVPGRYCHGRIHCATRTFQALRIAVNRELEGLDEAFRQAADLLAPGGRLCIISFHSLEDRIAKHTIRSLSQGTRPVLRSLTKKPILASQQEREQNPRARSAKLRVAERLDEGGHA